MDSKCQGFRAFDSTNSLKWQAMVRDMRSNVAMCPRRFPIHSNLLALRQMTAGGRDGL